MCIHAGYATLELEVSAMTVAPIPGQVPTSIGHGRSHGRFAWLAVGLSVVFLIATATAVTLLLIGYAVDGWNAIEDTALGLVSAVVAGVGLLAALSAFAFAIIAKVERERWTLLWLPLAAFPACVAFLVLGETLWWE